MAMVVEFFFEGASSLSAKGVEEGGDIIEFGGFVEIDPFDGVCIGKQVKEHKELSFREDAFFFAFCALAEDGLHNNLGVVLVVGAIIVVLIGSVVIVLDGDGIFHRDRRIDEKTWSQDLFGGLVQGDVEMGLRGGQELLKDIGSFVDEATVDNRIFACRGEFAERDDGIEEGCCPANKVLYRIVGPVLQDVGLGGREVSWKFFKIFFKMPE